MESTVTLNALAIKTMARGWLFKYPDLTGQSTYGFKTYEESAKEVQEAGYVPVKSDRIEVVELDME